MFSHPELFTSRLLFVGLFLEACETIRMRRSFDAEGVFSRAHIRILTSGARWPSRIGATVGGSCMIVTVMVAQACFALVVLALGTGSPAGIVAALLCLVTNGYLLARRQIGGSGADQLTFIALVTFGLVVLAGGTVDARCLGDAFIAAQLALAYFASGVAKAASPIWRKGDAMAAILSTEGYGTPKIATLLSRYRSVDKLVCWTVIGWEITFPLVLVAPKPAFIALLAMGVLFHLSCAAIMGLNRFLWAFCGCYPAVWATALAFR